MSQLGCRRDIISSGLKFKLSEIFFFLEKSRVKRVRVEIIVQVGSSRDKWVFSWIENL